MFEMVHFIHDDKNETLFEVKTSYIKCMNILYKPTSAECQDVSSAKTNLYY
jgi:hypothetical protein